MRPRNRRLSVALFIAPCLIVSGLLALNCAPDEDLSVAVVKDCDVARLTTDVPEATVKVYVETANDALARAQDIEKRFLAVCNKINKDLGDTDGTTLSAACNKIAARVQKAIALTPLPPGALPGTVAPWVAVGWEQSCTVDSHALATCEDTCSGSAPCDHDQKCGALVGSCAACSGRCDTRGEKVACNGQCSGTCDMPAAPAPDSGIDGGPSPACAGECVGTCKFPTNWTGRCTTGCNAGFQGQCLGTCTGTCNGSPVGDVVDAGGDTGDSGDAGEGGVEAGPVDAAAPVGADGNCAGFCKGQCSSGASGSCTTRCTGVFSGGQCTGAGNCVGVCNATATGCTATCTGRCTLTGTGGSCAGACTKCDGPVTNGACTGALDCPANDQCKAVCGVRAALATKCPAINVGELRVAGDTVLYTAIAKNIGEFATLANELTVVKNAVERIADRTPTDFKSIGLVTDRGFRCVDTGISTMGQARDTLNKSTGATNIFRGIQF